MQGDEHRLQVLVTERHLLVVADSENQLQDELTSASDFSFARTNVCVLPSNSSVLLVNADRVGQNDRLSFRSATESVDV